MLLVTGSPGAPFFPAILDSLLADLQTGVPARLVVPTHGAAERHREWLARQGVVVRPHLVTTLAQLAANIGGHGRLASSGTLQLLIDQALRSEVPRHFAKVARYAGFRSALREAMQEFASAGADAEQIRLLLQEQLLPSGTGPAFLQIVERVEEALRARGLVLRPQRYQAAAASGTWEEERLYVAGFAALTDPELSLLRSLASRVDLIVALPEWPGSEAARQVLLEIGLPEHSIDTPPAPAPELFTATSPADECVEIARRILAHVSAGRVFREIAVIVRGAEPYSKLLRTTFARFGIPVQIQFAGKLGETSVIRYLTAIVAALQSGWEYAATLHALQMTVSGLGGTPAGDQFSRAVRARLPGIGLPGLREVAADDAVVTLLDLCEQLSAWVEMEQPAAEWVPQVAGLQAFCAPSPEPLRPGSALAELWRQRHAVLLAFSAALAEAAEAFAPTRPLSFADFWQAVETVLARTNAPRLAAPADAVEVLDPYEARHSQWPLVFVCGLVQGQFPRSASPEPLFPEGVRVRLQETGFRLRTASDHAAEERFLFATALSRATSQCVLSFPESDGQGTAQLPSFYLEEMGLGAGQPAAPVRPSPSLARLPPKTPAILALDLQDRMVARHATLHPTAIESFLLCRFQFFSRYTLGIRPGLSESADRLDHLACGTLLHEVIARWHRRQSADPEAIFAAEFARHCTEQHIPTGFATERRRLQMLRDLRHFVKLATFPAHGSPRIETEFDLDLPHGLRVQGRIDRYDCPPDGGAYVVDYKYTSASGLQGRVRDESGRFVQGGLYLYALRAGEGLQPRAFHYYGLREPGKRIGWETKEEIDQLIQDALGACARLSLELQAGRIDVQSTDPAMCGYCDMTDACRWRVQETAR